MEIIDIIVNLERYSQEVVSYKLDAGFAQAVSEAAALLQAQGERIADLENELQDERYRHDRLQDFEVAEAKVLEEVRAERRWIPVGERLPEEEDDDWDGEKHTASDNVLVAVQNERNERFVSEDRTSDGRWVNYPWGGFKVTHWMPLPEPPEEV